jgi:protoheme IX farnesyltransferase
MIVGATTHPTSLFWTDLKALTKVRLALSVVFSALAGYLLGAESYKAQELVFLLVGGFSLVAASNAYNQVIEKDLDSKMNRTKERPLPTGRFSKGLALIIAFALTILGGGLLYFLNLKTALFGLLSVILYALIYTPLKTKTSLSVFVGAFPGAIPFMLGWVGATGSFGIEAGTLFMIQFFWQFPHFWSIGWLQFEEYKKAGFIMLPMDKKDESATKQIIFYTVIMILVSISPVFKLTGAFYIHPITAIIIALLGLSMLYYGVLLHKKQTNIEARKLMLSSVIYITMIQIIYVIDKFLH